VEGKAVVVVVRQEAVPQVLHLVVHRVAEGQGAEGQGVSDVRRPCRQGCIAWS
jgi:hypothetical protein